VGDNPHVPTPADATRGHTEALNLADAIRLGVCPSDLSFDRFLTDDVQRASDLHWTPIAVAVRIANWLDGAGARSVVDVGSGPGKFCVAAALAGRCSFTGIEQRSRLVREARALAHTFGVDDRVQFVHGALDLGTIPLADAYYLFNPFGENLFGRNEHLDDDVELNPKRYLRDVALMEEFFAAAPAGTLVVKFHGFGGRMPQSYTLLVDEPQTELRIWKKRRGPQPPPPRGGAA
jgi:SAM-dependent methyltransferase